MGSYWYGDECVEFQYIFLLFEHYELAKLNDIVWSPF
jgi:hypothetical protein